MLRYKRINLIDMAETKEHGLGGVKASEQKFNGPACPKTTAKLFLFVCENDQPHLNPDDTGLLGSIKSVQREH